VHYSVYKVFNVFHLSISPIYFLSCRFFFSVTLISLFFYIFNTFFLSFFFCLDNVICFCFNFQCFRFGERYQWSPPLIITLNAVVQPVHFSFSSSFSSLCFLFAFSMSFLFVSKFGPLVDYYNFFTLGFNANSSFLLIFFVCSVLCKL